jgi:replicative DNA helicase
MDPARTLIVAPAPEEPAYRTAPHNTEAEQALLGAIMVNNATYNRVSEFLRAEHFYNPAHQRIYEAAAHLIDMGRLADPKTMWSLFEHDKALTEIGGAQYLGRLAASVVTIINAGDYGRTILDCYLRRQLIEIATEAVNDAYEVDIDYKPSDLIAEVETKLYQLGDALENGSNGVQGSITIREAMRRAQARQEAAVQNGGAGGIPTGLAAYDSTIGGLFRKQLGIIAGRPSMGKSTFARTIASNVAEAGYNVAYFALEEDAEAIGSTETAWRTGIPVSAQVRGALGVNGVISAGDAIDELGDIPMYIFERAGVGLPYFQREGRRLKNRLGDLALIVIDHIQDTESGGKEENRRLELESLMRGLKSLAKELNCHIMALSQLNRGVEARDDKRPLLSDLRETGAIEQSADIVGLLYREEYYLVGRDPVRRENETIDKFDERKKWHFERSNACRGLAEMQIAKGRFLEKSTLKFHFDGKRSRFTDIGGV